MMADCAQMVTTRQASRKKPRMFTGYREMLRQKDLDLAKIATPDHCNDRGRQAQDHQSDGDSHQTHGSPEFRPTGPTFQPFVRGGDNASSESESEKARPLGSLRCRSVGHIQPRLAVLAMRPRSV